MAESKEEQAPSYKKQLLDEMYAMEMEMEMEMERIAEIFNILMVEKILTCFYDKDLSSIDLISQRLCLEGSRRQANSALHALKTKDAGLQSVSVVYKSHVDISEEEKTHFPSVLQSTETRAKEIGGFTAPEAAYIDELIEDTFHLIVGTIHGLKDTSGPSVGRRVVILETPAKNRSCVVMLDLKCEDLVNGIFSTFFPVARLQQEMQKYLAIRQMHQDGDAPEVQKKILHCFCILSRLFADPVKAEESFQFPDQLKDINIWKILTNLVDPNTGSPQACILRITGLICPIIQIPF